MSYQFSNNASSVLTAQLPAVGTTANITPADASKFPVPSGAAVFMATLQKATGEFEIVQCTANPLTGAMTIVRAQEGTAAQQFEIGDVFSLRLTAGALNTFAQSDGTVQTNLNAQKVNGIEAATTAQPNKLLALNGSGLLPASITGNAATATNSSNLGGNSSAYHLNRANHTGQLPYDVKMYSSANSPVTYNKPAGIVKVRVTVIGGGGGGGGATDTTTGGGGGGGGTAIKEILAASLGDTETITIGAGGALSSNGGNSSFGAHATGNGGSAGVNGGSGGAGGAGGTASGGDLNFTGQAGPDISTTRGGLTYHGVAGSGGAGSSGTSAGGAPGSAGVTGIVIVEEFY